MPPAKSESQRRYMAMCAFAKNPPKGCPSRKVAREFVHKAPEQKPKEWPRKHRYF